MRDAGPGVERRLLPDLTLEATWWCEGYRRIAGVDEVGRGALFGPVVAAAVVLPPDWDPSLAPGLTDSKLLAPQRRQELHDIIVARAVAVSVGLASSEVIDEIGIVPANLRAMSEALSGLDPAPDVVIVDGIGPLPKGYRGCALIGGDARCLSVSAASVVAKVTRDRLVCELAREFPQYDLDGNKGYGTPSHREALARLGPTRLHRYSFSPVAAALRDRCSILDAKA